MEELFSRKLEALERLQEKDGSWRSLASADLGSAKKTDARETVFPAALILACLSGIDARSARVDKMRRRAARFLASQMSPRGTWNYAKRGSKTAKARPYPDDLDDTSCALSALALSSVPLDGGTLAGFARALIACETREGGPYRTWIAPRGRGFDDVDVAVNANVAYALGLQETFLDNLSSYIDSAVRKRRFVSLYYKSPYAFAYFISRFYSLRKDDAPTRELARIAESLLSKAKNALDLSLAISSLARLGRGNEIPSERIKELRTCSWDAHPLYIEEIKGGETLFAGSKALTTAFALEALSLAAKAHSRSETDQGTEKALGLVRARRDAYFQTLGEPLERAAREACGRFVSDDMERLIALLPYSFASAISAREKTGKDALARLGLANALGWTGYSIQDDVMDEAKGLELLPLSNVLIRESLDLMSGAVPKEGKGYVRKVFGEIDRANAREASSLSLQRTRNGFELPKKAPSVEEGSLAGKSFGHALAPLAIIMRLGYEPESREFKAIERFFRHYIIARQLNDDAHDWREDLSGGRINSASARAVRAYLKRRPKSLSLEDAKEALDRVFWEESIDEIVADIRRHIRKALSAAKSSGLFGDLSYPKRLLEPLERSAAKALAERDKAIEFVESL